MIKVRMMGSKKELTWLTKILAACPFIELSEESEFFRSKGTNRFYRKYVTVSKKDNKNGGNENV